MGSVRKWLLAVVMVAAIAYMLSACSLLPVGPGVYLDGDNAQADAQMEKIANTPTPISGPDVANIVEQLYGASDTVLNSARALVNPPS